MLLLCIEMVCWTAGCQSKSPSAPAVANSTATTDTATTAAVDVTPTDASTTEASTSDSPASAVLTPDQSDAQTSPPTNVAGESTPGSKPILTDQPWNHFLHQTVDGLAIGDGTYRIDRSKQKELTDDQQRLVKKMEHHALQMIQLRERGEREPATRDLETAMAIMFELWGPEYKAAIDLVPILAELYESLGHYDLARHALLDVQGRLSANALALKDTKKQIARLERISHMTDAELQEYAQLCELRRKLDGTHSAGRVREGLELSRQCLALVDKLFGNESLEYAHALNNVATLLQDTGQLKDAITLQLRALDRFQLLASDPISQATAMSNIGELYSSAGDTLKAIEWIERAQAMRESLGDSVVISQRCHLAVLYGTIGQFLKADRLLLNMMDTINTDTKSGINKDSDTIELLFAYQSVLGYRGNYRKKLDVLRQIEPLVLKVHGQQSLLYCKYLAAMGSLWHALDDSEKASLYFEQYKDRIESLMGPEHPTYSHACHNLAHALTDTDRPRAQGLHETALKIQIETYGAGSLMTADSWLSLAQLAVLNEDYKQALDYLKTPLEHLDQENTSNQRTLAYLKNCEAMAYRGLKRFDEALLAARESLVLFEVSHGQNHKEVGTIRQLLSRLFAEAGHLDEADAELRLAFNMVNRYVKDSFAGLSEHNRILVMDQMRAIINQSMAQAFGQDAADRVEEIYSQAVNWKGLVAALGRSDKARSLTPESAKAWNKLSEMRSQYATLALAIPPPDAREAWQSELQKLKLAKEELEAKLSENNRYETSLRELSIAEISAAVPSNAVFVDFYEYEIERGKDRYLDAYIVRQGQPVERIELGEVKTIANDIQLWREQIHRGGDEFNQAQSRLSQRLLAPLAKYLSDKQLLIISPDGVVNRIALQALSLAKDGQPLLTTMAVSKVVSARQLVDIAASRASQATPAQPPTAAALLAVGGVQFEKNQFQPDPSASLVQSLVRSGFEELPGTLREIDTTQQLFGVAFPSAKIEALRGEAADEKGVKEKLAQHPQYIHLATHGFFVPATVTSSSNASSESRGQAMDSKTSGLSPLLQSGLVFRKTTATPESPQAEDGILTAEEVNNFNLSGTRLVVLSACETGLGNVAGGEGVLGLQRAFYVAGAESVITSLWKVDDAATEILMSEFYKNHWGKKMSKIHALRLAQLRLMQSYDPTTSTLRGLGSQPIPIKPQANTSARQLPPVYWSAFELSGDWK